jgi:hypothetical protein
MGMVPGFCSGARIDKVGAAFYASIRKSMLMMRLQKTWAIVEAREDGCEAGFWGCCSHV